MVAIRKASCIHPQQLINGIDTKGRVVGSLVCVRQVAECEWFAQGLQLFLRTFFLRIVDNNLEIDALLRKNEMCAQRRSPNLAKVSHQTQKDDYKVKQQEYPSKKRVDHVAHRQRWMHPITGIAIKALAVVSFVFVFPRLKHDVCTFGKNFKMRLLRSWNRAHHRVCVRKRNKQMKWSSGNFLQKFLCDPRRKVGYHLRSCTCRSGNLTRTHIHTYTCFRVLLIQEKYMHRCTQYYIFVISHAHTIFVTQLFSIKDHFYSKTLTSTSASLLNISHSLIQIFVTTPFTIRGLDFWQFEGRTQRLVHDGGAVFESVAATISKASFVLAP